MLVGLPRPHDLSFRGLPLSARFVASLLRSVPLSADLRVGTSGACFCDRLVSNRLVGLFEVDARPVPRGECGKDEHREECRRGPKEAEHALVAPSILERLLNTADYIARGFSCFNGSLVLLRLGGQTGNQMIPTRPGYSAIEVDRHDGPLGFEKLGDFFLDELRSRTTLSANEHEHGAASDLGLQRLG